MVSFKQVIPLAFLLFILPMLSFGGMPPSEEVSIAGIPVEFVLFGLTLLGIALFHHHTLKVAIAGLSAVLLVKLLLTDFDLGLHLLHEWHILVNLLGLLIGFAVLAKHFEESKVPDILPAYLPDDWKGGFVLLVLTFILSSFLDNIASAMIGGMIAAHVFKHKVHIGYLAAIVAAANAGGAGSVLGDTTTTMMWIDGISAFSVLEAFIASIAALLFFGFIASLQQDKYNRIQKDAKVGVKIDYGKLVIVGLILIGAIATNILFDFPALGVWIGIIIGALFKDTNWKEALHAIPGTIFLLCLVLTASMMPVDQLPPASVGTTFFLGFISSVFDNIPLTKLALTQGGFDWGVLAYAVGFGGSMVWFGSSAGVALSNIFPETRSVFKWLKNGWHIIIAYIIGFLVLYLVVGWHPDPPHKAPDEPVYPSPSIK